MQSTDIPQFIPERFANSVTGTLVNYPLPDTVAGGSGLASWDQGWQAINATDPGAGGIAPIIADFNGVLKQMSGWDQWFSVGGPIMYNALISAAIGGYPRGAILASATTLGQLWLSTAENNTTNPDTGGSGWAAFNAYHNVAPTASHVQSASIGPSYADTLTLSFVAPCAGVLRASSNINLGNVANGNVSTSITNTINGTVSGSTTKLSQVLQQLIPLVAGNSLSVSLIVTSVSG